LQDMTDEGSAFAEHLLNKTTMILNN